MDAILRDSVKSERRNHRRLGLICIAGGLALTAGTYAVSGGSYYLVSLGVFAFGLTRLFA
ncbi:MAG TPA: hypothetical protein VH143_06140 [Kofleriaceae bacterium]|jgi:hypothetical protein|nr:hypothetical protein [Kofleriaceae bacterium]